MDFLIFFIILSILVLSHELGHFLAAKYTNTKVEEFGFGFPPKIFSFKKGETIYSLNLFPIGGFVKILGENGEEKKDIENKNLNEDKDRNFYFKSVYAKIFILSDGVLFNLLLAWILLSFSLTAGNLKQINDDEVLDIPSLVVITEILENSPAYKIGLKPGDIIINLYSLNKEQKEISISYKNKLNISKIIDVQNFINENKGKEISITVKRGTEIFSSNVNLRDVPSEKGSLGVAMARVINFKPPFYLAIIYGFRDTIVLTGTIAVAIFYFFTELLKGQGFEQVAGPVGIFNIVSEASNLGISYLARLAAVLSINLAVINFLPFPALDGGRVFMILIEKIKKSPIKQKYVNAINMLGFAALIILMFFITYSDILKIIKK